MSCVVAVHQARPRSYWRRGDDGRWCCGAWSWHCQRIARTHLVDRKHPLRRRRFGTAKHHRHISCTVENPIEEPDITHDSTHSHSLTNRAVRRIRQKPIGCSNKWQMLHCDTTQMQMLASSTKRKCKCSKLVQSANANANAHARMCSLQTQMLKCGLFKCKCSKSRVALPNKGQMPNAKYQIPIVYFATSKD